MFRNIFRFWTHMFSHAIRNEKENHMNRKKYSQDNAET